VTPGDVMFPTRHGFQGHWDLRRLGIVLASRDQVMQLAPVTILGTSIVPTFEAMVDAALVARCEGGDG